MSAVLDHATVGGPPALAVSGGRLGGAAMVAAPLLLTAGAALLTGIYAGSADAQLEGLAAHPGRAHLAVNLAIAGTIAAAFALASLANHIAATQPRLGRWGGALTLIGLFGPAFFLGINHIGILLTDLPDRAGAARAFEDAHATPNIVNLAGPAIVVGFIVLAVGAARSGVLPRTRSWALGVAAIAPVGLMSGVVVIAVVAWLMLAVAIVPLGIQQLRAGSTASSGPLS